MGRELKHPLDRAVGPHYKRDTKLPESLRNTFRDGFSAPYSSTQHLEGSVLYGDRFPSLTVQES